MACRRARRTAAEARGAGDACACVRSRRRVAYVAPEQSSGRIEDLLWPGRRVEIEKPTGIEYQ
jgi:hypothetical protein